MFEEEYRNRINRVVEYIEQNLETKLTLKVLAEHAGISPFHLHRLFLVYTGEPLSGFIRRIRLAAGLSQIRKDKDTTVLDAAIAVGYESVSSFVRAFRQRFGFTPKSIPIPAKSSLSLWKTQKSESSKIVTKPDRIEMRASQKILGALELGYQNRSFQKAAERAFSRTLKLLDEHKLQTQVGRACAAVFDDPDLSDASAIKYFGGFEWMGTDSSSYRGLESMPLAPGTYAVFIHRGSYKSLWQVWNAAYRNWLPNSEFELRDVAPFEIYLNDPRTVRSEKELITEIYLPIERRKL